MTTHLLTTHCLKAVRTERPGERARAACVVRWLALVAALWLGCSGLVPGGRVAAQNSARLDVAVVVNRDNPVRRLSLPELREILLGERTHWKPGRPISLIVIPGPGARERRIVLRSVLGMDDASYRRHWVGRVFRAESASAPTSADSVEMIPRAVARIRGAIGLVSQAAASSDVVVVRIDGMVPGDPAYPLR